MKNILTASVTFLLLCTSVQGADKIRISIPFLSGQFMTFPLAHKRGFLKEEGIDAEIIRITGATGGLGVNKWRSGLRYWHGRWHIGGAITGRPIKVVACYVPAPVLALVARPEIKSVQELRGKTVGINAFGNVAHFAARVIAKHFGLDPERDVSSSPSAKSRLVLPGSPRA